MRINYCYIYAEDEKAGSELGALCFRRHWLGLCNSHLTEDEEICSFKVGSDGALFEKIRRTTSHHLE